MQERFNTDEDEKQSGSGADSPLIGQVRSEVEGFQWDFEGLARENGDVIELPPESKVVTIIFEHWTQSRIEEMVVQQGWNIRVDCNGSRQYPDITLTDNEFGDGRLLAVDVKTGRKANSGIKLDGPMTLGSYAGYFGNPSKNHSGISEAYEHFDEHWLICFPHVWSEDKGTKQMVSDVDVIIGEKWELAGLLPGSGNTNNIGSVKDISRLESGNGDFESKEQFEEYYREIPPYETRRSRDIDIKDDVIPAWKQYLDDDNATDFGQFLEDYLSPDTTQSELPD